MTKQEIYEQIVRLTAELYATNVAKKIFSAVKEGDSAKAEKVSETFKEENPELHERIVSFGEEYNRLIKKSETGLDGEIFGEKENTEEGIFVFDTSIIDPISLYAFTFFSNIEEGFLFDVETKSFERFIEPFKEFECDALIEFLWCDSWQDWIGENEEDYSTVYELLVAIFAGELDGCF